MLGVESRKSKSVLAAAFLILSACGTNDDIENARKMAVANSAAYEKYNSNDNLAQRMKDEAAQSASHVATSAAAPSDRGSDSSNAANGSLLERCIDAGLAVGYKEAHCAEAFVDTCMETQSKERMAQIAYNDQNLLGNMRPGIVCGNGEPAKYLREFAARQQQHDRF